MSQGFPGQIGKGVVKLFDADSRETKVYDEAAGVQYTNSNPDVVRISDEDADPLTADFEALAEGQAIIDVTLDTRLGEEQNLLHLQAVIDVVLPPPGEAATGTFEVVFEQVPAAPE